MKKTITILFTILFTFICKAQDQNLERANKYFKRTFYSEAIPLYEKFLKSEQSKDAIKNLADSYFYINDMNNAAKNYKYLLRVYKKYIDKSYYLKYATTLKAQNKYKEANNVLRNYYKGDKERLIAFEKEIEYLENIEALGNRFNIKSLGINTSESIQGKKFGWNGQSYLDLYKVPVDKIHLGDSVAEPFSDKLNTKLHESNIIFTQDGKTAYFTRNSSEKGKRKTDDKKVTHVQLFRTQLIDGEWVNTTSLPFNSNEYSTEHPTLSPDGKTLYFASDMPKGFGSFDIYKVDVNSDGSFGSPINVFVSSIKEGNLSKPDNVGFPINSGYDDFAFNINSETKEGFFASNRLGGEGNDDIYKIIEEKPLIIEYCKQFISGVITDIDTDEVLPNTTIVLTGTNLKTPKKITTNTKGEFKFTVECKSSFAITASKTGYTTEKTTIKTNKKRNKDNDASLKLKSLERIRLEKVEVEEERKRKEAVALRLKQKREQKIRSENYAKRKR